MLLLLICVNINYVSLKLTCSVRYDENVDVAKSKVTKLYLEGPVSRNKCDIHEAAIIEPKDESERVHRGVIHFVVRRELLNNSILNLLPQQQLTKRYSGEFSEDVR